ncbi:MAG: hypothetical protein LHW51_09290 [Candidatus Cloacimonetes bacterium]|nr:hypothetical protein [Candidatus Cloacimonadota bacterium]
MRFFIKAGVYLKVAQRIENRVDLLDCRRLACRAWDLLIFQDLRPCWTRDASNPANIESSKTSYPAKLSTLLLILIWSTFPAFLPAQGRGLSFETEQLSFTVQDSLWLFEGDFGFYNSGTKALQQAIFFPVPANEKQSRAMQVSVSIEEQQKSFAVSEISPQGFWFQLSMQPQSYETIRIRYQQSLQGSQASYVLLSALTWGKPLAYASYSLRLPQGSKLLHYPFANPEQSTQDEWDIYYWQFYDFVPEVNFEAEWER